MKRKLIVIISLVLTAVLFTLAGCNKDAFAGDYKEATAEQREEVLAKLNAHEVVEDKKTNYVVDAWVTVQNDDASENVYTTTSMKIEEVIDYSQDNKILASLSLEFAVRMRQGSDNHKYDFKLDLTFDSSKAKAYVLMEGNGDVPGMKSVAKKKRYIDMGFAQLESITGDDTQIDIDEVLKLLDSDKVKLYVDKNKAKISYEVGTSSFNYYFVFEKDNKFKAKLEAETSTRDTTIKINSEMVPTSKKVNLPSDPNTYSTPLSLTELLGFIAM